MGDLPFYHNGMQGVSRGARRLRTSRASLGALEGSTKGDDSIVGVNAQVSASKATRHEIIIVGVVLETIKAIESQMLVRYYKGFLKD